MANFAEGGPDIIGDLARQGGTPSTSLTNGALSVSGPGFWADLAREGGAVVSLTITGTPVLTGQNGVAYAGFTATAHGGSTPYVYSLVGTWPTGITVNSSTGAVSGTPTQTGSFASLSVRATDANTTTANLTTFTLVVAAP